MTKCQTLRKFWHLELFRCASISWFQVVSQWVSDFFTASASTGLSELFPYVAPTNVWIKNQNVSENLMRWRRRRNVKLWQKPPFWSSQQCVGLQLSHNISQQALAGCTWRPTAWFETHAGAKAWFGKKKSFWSRAAPSRCKARCIYSGCGNSCKQTNNKKNNIPTQNQGC